MNSNIIIIQLAAQSQLRPGVTHQGFLPTPHSRERLAFYIEKVSTLRPLVDSRRHCGFPLLLPLAGVSSLSTAAGVYTVYVPSCF